GPAGLSGNVGWSGSRRTLPLESVDEIEEARREAGMIRPEGLQAYPGLRGKTREYHLSSLTRVVQVQPRVMPMTEARCRSAACTSPGSRSVRKCVRS